MQHELGCGCCGVPVKVSKNRYRQLVLSDQLPFCKQCGRYVRSGASRMTELSSEQEFPSLGLCKKTKAGSKKRRSLESMPLARCGKRTYEDGG